jgi:RimJ/RimL family protein N-acetyltransferase
MNFKKLNCISENIDLQDYYKLYDFVRDNMKHPEWLGYIPINETKIILSKGGKIWLYYDNDNLVCSMFYIPSNNELLRKHNLEYDENETGSLGPIMVNPYYVGKGYMREMLAIFNEYNKSIHNKYIFTKAASDNLYSIRNIENDGYKLVDVYKNNRGLNNAYLKELDY